MKNILLQTNYFIDNEWLKKYIKLTSKDAKIGYTEKHHIIPVSIYKYQNNCKTRYEAEVIADKDIKNKVVKLSFIDHCKAHLYLYNCTIGEVKHSNEIAFRIMVEDKVKIKNADLTKEEEQLLISWKNKILVESKWYWSDDEIKFIKKNYNKLTVEQLSQQLGRTKKSIGNYITRLRIAESKSWTDDQVEFLKLNYTKLTAKQIAEQLQKTKSAVDHKAQRLGLKK